MRISLIRRMDFEIEADRDVDDLAAPCGFGNRAAPTARAGARKDRRVTQYWFLRP
jgi:hypothetical protein